MTDERKPETPGLSEVSAKFVDAAHSRDPVFDQIEQIEEEQRSRDAMPDDEKRDLATDRITEREVRVFKTRAEALSGLLAKARMAYRISTGRTASGEPLQTPDGPKVTVAGDPSGGVGGLDDPVLIWSLLQDLERMSGEGADVTPTHSAVDLRDQWDRLRLDLEDLNRKHDQLSDSEYGKRFDDIVQALGDIETAIQHAPANDWQTVLVKLHVAVGLAQDQVGKLDKHDHPFVELLRTVTRDVGRLGEKGTVTRMAVAVAAMTDEPVHDALNGLADSLSMVDTARHALGTILEDMSGQPGENIGFCILRTLDAAAKQGHASFDIVWDAAKGKAASCDADRFLFALIENMEATEEIAGNMVPDGRGGTYDRLNERSRDLSRQIMDTRAQSVQGLTWKLRQLVSTLELEEGVSKYEMDMARSALADAERLTGEAQS